MKTLLISPLWLDSPHEDSMKRNIQWLVFMIPLKNKLGYDEILLIDNASTPKKVDYIEQLWPVTIHRCKTHIPRGKHLEYGYWYSALAIGSKYAIDNGYDKLLYIDTDFYPLTERMCEYTKKVTEGWTGMYCHKHNFPETCYQIIGKDKLHDFYEWHSRGFLKFYPNLDAESQTPFTHVERMFTGDRYGEFMNSDGSRGLPQTEDMDYYGQNTTQIVMTFNLAQSAGQTESLMKDNK